jgi:hypothetical protein
MPRHLVPSLLLAAVLANAVPADAAAAAAAPWIGRALDSARSAGALVYPAATICGANGCVPVHTSRVRPNRYRRP